MQTRTLEIGVGLFLLAGLLLACCCWPCGSAA